MSKYRGGFEEKMAAAFKRRAVDFQYEIERLKYVVPAVEHTYKPDFTFIRPDGHKIYVETKGYFDSDSRKKMLLVVKDNPTLDIRMLFQDARTTLVSKRKRGVKVDGTKMESMSYGEWCDKHGIEWAAGRTIHQLGEVIKKWYHEADE